MTKFWKYTLELQRTAVEAKQVQKRISLKTATLCSSLQVTICQCRPGSNFVVRDYWFPPQRGGCDCTAGRQGSQPALPADGTLKWLHDTRGGRREGGLPLTAKHCNCLDPVCETTPLFMKIQVRGWMFRICRILLQKQEGNSLYKKKNSFRLDLTER